MSPQSQRPEGNAKAGKWPLWPLQKTLWLLSPSLVSGVPSSWLRISVSVLLCPHYLSAVPVTGLCADRIIWVCPFFSQFFIFPSSFSSLPPSLLPSSILPLSFLPSLVHSFITLNFPHSFLPPLLPSTLCVFHSLFFPLVLHSSNKYLRQALCEASDFPG